MSFYNVSMSFFIFVAASRAKGQMTSQSWCDPSNEALPDNLKGLFLPKGLSNRNTPLLPVRFQSVHLIG